MKVDINAVLLRELRKEWEYAGYDYYKGEHRITKKDFPTFEEWLKKEGLVDE